MGKRGPRPTPKKTLEARGSRLSKSRPNEPDPPSGLPEKPEWLGQIASQKWDEIIPRLVEQGIMSPLYGDFLSLYCQAHQDLHDAMETLNNEGSTCISEKGGVYPHPAVAMKQSAIALIVKLGQEFGFSAASVRDVTSSKQPTRKAGLSGSARKR